MAGGPYNIPRNTKGEGRFFYIFSTKALIVTAVLGGMAFFVFRLIGSLIGFTALGVIGALIFGVIGFAVTSFKIPDSNNFEITRKAGGEYIDQIIIRYIKFKMQKNKIYTFFTEEKNDE
jgi:hypothetical protein